ncbi:hypothetical protein AB8B21_05585 [Tardiphaga sp. 866_E4_N2_1]|uniref:hypothetical protein n=1 Tax=unclassified Tardiphaga TaxID=2631404 RepID=UPI003F1E7FF2
MSAEEIIADVLKRTRVSEEDFFGPFRAPRFTVARALAISEMTHAGMTKMAIARAIRRNHVTVVYWQRAEFRQKRKAYYENYNTVRRAGREKRPLTQVKATREQRAQLLGLLAEGRLDEMVALQASLGVNATYTRRLASRIRMDDLRRRGIEAPERKKGRQKQPQKIRVSKLVAAEPPLPVFKDRPVKVPSHLLDDARRRAVAQRSLTAVAFGDPPPGYSALDRREMRT